MFFGGKKEKKVKSRDAQAHLVFRLASMFVVGFIVYKVYLSGGDASNISNDLSVDNVNPAITEDKIQTNVKKAFEKMSNSPEFKKVKEFVDYIDQNKSDKQVKILDASDGYLIYLPNSLVEKDSLEKSVEASDEKIKVNINIEKVDRKKEGQ